MCLLTALGCWLSSIRDYFGKKDSIFIRTGDQASGSKNDSTQLKEMLDGYHKEIMSFGFPAKKTKLHEFCEGSGTDSTSGTTATPSWPSVALCGEWSQGTVFNIYLQFAAEAQF